MKTLVLLHGWGVRPSVFDGLREKLARGYEVHALALPGYDDCATRSPYDLPGLADSIAADAPEHCGVVGWSLGGQVALEWARRVPEQVERIACIGATPCFVQCDSWRCAMEPRVLQDFASGLEFDVKRTLKRFSLLQAHGDSNAKGVVLALRNALAAPPSVDAQALLGGLHILRDSDLRSSLAAVEHDVLVVHGETDTLVPLAAAQYLASALPRGKLLVVPRAGHVPFVSNAESVALELRAFFA